MRVLLAVAALFMLSGSLQADDKGFSIGGLNFGIGLGVTHNWRGADRVESAVVSAANEVRVTKLSNTQAGLLYELHYFFAPQTEFKPWVLSSMFESSVPPGSWGHGPFVAVRSSEESIIGGIGAGWMLGLKQSKGDADESTSSWNIGLGFIVDPDSKRLATGFTDGEPLPDGEITIVFREQSELSAMLMFSFGF